MKKKAALCLVVALATCAAMAGDGEKSKWLPECIGEFGDKVDTLFYALLYSTAFFFGVVLIALTYLCLRYRAQNGKKAEYAHGNSWKATALTGSLAMLVFMVMDMNTLRLSKAASAVLENPPDTANALHIKVLGKQFSWLFMYPGKDGKFGAFNVKKGTDDNWFGADEKDAAGKDDVQSEALLVVPVNRPIFFEIRAKDVIHSFFIPVTRLKQDAVPGLVSKMWFTPRQKGDYTIVCSELCGFMHSQMAGIMRVVDEKDYEKWLDEKIQDK